MATVEARHGFQGQQPPGEGAVLPERLAVARELVGEIQWQAVIGRLHGKFSPLIRVRNEKDDLERLDDGRTNRNQTEEEVLKTLLAGSADRRTGYDSVRWFGQRMEDWRRLGHNWEWGADGEYFNPTKVEKRWYGLSERESRDYFELQPLQGGNMGFSRIYYAFSQSGPSAMETRRNVDQFSVVVPSKLANEIWEAVEMDPQLPLALIYAAYPGSGAPMADAEILKAMKKYKLGDKLPDEKTLDLIRSASVIERRAPLTGIYMVDGRQHDLAVISDATAFLREAYVPYVPILGAPRAEGEKVEELMAEAARRAEGGRVEEEFTSEERDAMLIVGAVARLEIAPGPLDRDELYNYFLGAKIAFSRLPLSSKVRAEIIKNVSEQLGAEGERMRKAGKKDEEVFEEWLKLVFIPLYRRVGKKRRTGLSVIVL